MEGRGIYIFCQIELCHNTMLFIVLYKLIPDSNFVQALLTQPSYNTHINQRRQNL